MLLKNIWLTAEKFGGRLTYDKHTDRGTPVKVIEFFHMPVMAKRLQSRASGRSLAFNPRPAATTLELTPSRT